MNLIKYIINHTSFNLERLLTPWNWLVGDGKEIIVVTKMGDLLLKDPTNKLYFLSTCEGSIEHVSNYQTDFLKNKLSQEQYFEIFQPELIEDIEQDGKHLQEGEVYSYMKLPVMGGEVNDVANIHCSDIYRHFRLTGEVHRQISELGD